MINSFRGKYCFLSNFYEVPVTVYGRTYRNNESAFQAQKVIIESDAEDFTNLSASEAKRLGRKVRLRCDWEEIKYGVMYDIVLCKFKQNEDLKQMLIETKDEYLEEGNTWGDRVWGTVNGVGKNLLGEILMQVREELK